MLSTGNVTYEQHDLLIEDISQGQFSRCFQQKLKG